MMRNRTEWRSLAPYGLVVISLCVFIGLYSITERERYNSVILLSRAMEIQNRITEIQERLTIVEYTVETASREHERLALPPSQLGYIKFNLSQMQALPYIDQFLTSKDLKAARGMIGLVDSELPALLKDEKLDTAKLRLNDALSAVGYMQGNAIIRNQALTQALDIEQTARRNRQIAFVAAVLLSVLALYLFRHNISRRRQQAAMRVFYILFAHMTRTRIVSLRLFLQQLDSGPPLPLELRQAAQATAVELSDISDRLLAIGYDGGPGPTQSLAEILQRVLARYSVPIAADVSPRAEQIRLEASHWHLILDELLSNAAEAMQRQPDPLITIQAFVRTSILGGHTLFVEISDNGVGMSPIDLARATDPFFSTRAGTHTGLGLTSCAEMLKRMSGGLNIYSTQGEGTQVRVRCRV